MGAWIEIKGGLGEGFDLLSRTPRWVRGLKLNSDTTNFTDRTVAPHDGCVDWNSRHLRFTIKVSRSHPTMGAWIEMTLKDTRLNRPSSHPTMGAWIEISRHVQMSVSSNSRTPRWVRGLKYSQRWAIPYRARSHPTMGAWIEITRHVPKAFHMTSHPTMGAWIEILMINDAIVNQPVAPHDGCVDWNQYRLLLSLH